MKKIRKYISVILALALAMSCASFAFADTAATESADEPDSLALTLDVLEQRMLTTGTAKELADIHRLQDRAVASSNSETQRTLEDAFKSSGASGTVEDYIKSKNLNSASPTYASDVMMATMEYNMGLAIASIASASMPNDTFSLKQIELAKKYYNNNYEKNYEADLNGIRESALTTFYQMLQLQEYNKISKESLAIAENTYKLVQKKYKLGSASKLDLLTAEMDYQTAQSSAMSTQNNYETALMAFNLQNEYPLMQQTVFEGGDVLASAPAITLEDAIKSAVENRNEVGQMHFAKEYQDLTWAHTQLVSSGGSSTYLNAKAAYLQVTMADRLIEPQIELEIRQRFGDIEAKRLAAESAEATLTLTQEAYRITNISYGLGAATLSDLQKTANNLAQAKLGKVKAIADYNQAVKELEFAVGVGTQRISLGQ